MRQIKIILILSLALNILLICSISLYILYAKAHTAKRLAISAEIEAKVLEDVVSTLNSDDSEKIASLKKRLQKELEFAKSNADRLEEMAKQQLLYGFLPF